MLMYLDPLCNEQLSATKYSVLKPAKGLKIISKFEILLPL